MINKSNDEKKDLKNECLYTFFYKYIIVNDLLSYKCYWLWFSSVIDIDI